MVKEKDKKDIEFIDYNKIISDIKGKLSIS